MITFNLTLSAMGCAGPSKAWGGGQFDPNFLTASEAPIEAKHFNPYTV